jgi:hypothetical protein
MGGNVHVAAVQTGQNNSRNHWEDNPVHAGPSKYGRTQQVYAENQDSYEKGCRQGRGKKLGYKGTCQACKATRSGKIYRQRPGVPGKQLRLFKVKQVKAVVPEKIKYNSEE